APRIAPRRDRVSEDEECRTIAASRPEPLHEHRIFALEHRLKALATHVALGRPVERVAHHGVVCGDRLRYRPRGTADAEEPAGDFLPGADLCKRSVLRGIEVDP